MTPFLYFAAVGSFVTRKFAFSSVFAILFSTCIYIITQDFAFVKHLFAIFSKKVLTRTNVCVTITSEKENKCLLLGGNIDEINEKRKKVFAFCFGNDFTNNECYP